MIVLVLNSCNLCLYYEQLFVILIDGFINMFSYYHRIILTFMIVITLSHCGNHYLCFLTSID